MLNKIDQSYTNEMIIYFALLDLFSGKKHLKTRQSIIKQNGNGLVHYANVEAEAADATILLHSA